MTDRDKIIRIAEGVMGWKARAVSLTSGIFDAEDGSVIVWPRTWNPLGAIFYTFDMEAAIHEKDRADYHRHLECACVPVEKFDEFDPAHMWALVHATPRQRCDAAIAMLEERGPTPPKPLKGDQMEVKKELNDREFVQWCREQTGYSRDEAHRLMALSRSKTNWCNASTTDLCDLAELRLDLAEARKDTARLDWLIANPHMSLSPRSPKGEYVIWDQSEGLTIAGRGDSARAAIDAAGDNK